jgi:hypothetical protein
LVSIKKQLIRAAAVGAVGVATTVGFMGPALAAPAGVHAVGVARVAAKGPNSNITGSPAKFSPTKLTVKPVTKAKCKTTNYSFSVSNVTAKSQTVQVKNGSGAKVPFFTLKPKTAEGVCVTGSKGASGQLFIKGSKSVLTVTLS